MGFLDSLLGKSSANASNAAAADTYAKQQAAIAGLTQYGDQYRDDYRNLATQYQPYQQAGTSALSRLLGGLGLGSGDEQSQFTQAYRGLPGYQSGLERGQESALGAVNAGGMLNSGKALKSLYRYGSDYEDQRSGQYLDRLAGLSGQGMTATNAAVGTEGQGLQGQMATRQSAFGGQMQSAPVIGQGQIAGEQAKQGALTNLMSMGAYLGGSFLGGPMGGAAGQFNNRASSFKPAPAYQPTPWG
jgi:hypothetical protein